MNIWHDISPKRIKADNFFAVIEITKAVSYTHLDVYKRQPQRCDNFINRHCGNQGNRNIQSQRKNTVKQHDSDYEYHNHCTGNNPCFQLNPSKAPASSRIFLQCPVQIFRLEIRPEDIHNDIF